MSGHLQSGAHPDADSLSAFLEGVLPEHERLECLAHFAQCPQCREVVFLAQEPAAPVATVPVAKASFWRRWFTPMAVLSGAAAAVAIVVAVSSDLRHKPPAPSAEVVASASPALQVPAPLPTMESKPAAPPAAKTESTVAENRPAFRKKDSVAAPAAAALPAAPVPLPVTSLARVSSTASPAPPIQSDSVGAQSALNSTRAPAAPRAGLGAMPVESRAVLAQPSAPASTGPLRLRIQHGGSPVEGLSEIAGSVTDPSGAAVPAAVITLNQVTGATSGKTQSDEKGQFKLTDLPAGQYELRVTAPGFQSASGHIDLQARDSATVAPVLPAGAATETVEVTAQAGAAATRSSEPRSFGAIERLAATDRKVSAAPAPAGGAATPQAYLLPSKRPVVSTVTSGKLVLAADSAGVLFYSKNAGKSWKAVKPAWTGKVVRVATLAGSPIGHDSLQLTTDAGSVWLSADGIHWHVASPQR